MQSDALAASRDETLLTVAPAYLVIGLGNLLQGDDGFGVRVALQLQQRLGGELPRADLGVLDGGTVGLGLLPYLDARQRVIFVDVIDAGLAAGTPLRVDDVGEAILRNGPLSPHDIDLRDLMLAARLTGHAPAEPRRILVL